MKTVYWVAEGQVAEEWTLCGRCYGEVADEVMVVPGPFTVWAWGNLCLQWHSLRDMTTWSGGGPHSAYQGVCRGCAREGTSVLRSRSYAKQRISIRSHEM